MKIKLHNTFGVLAAVSILLTGCGNSAKEFEQSEETTAEIEAAQMAGRKAAKGFVNGNFSDTTALHLQLLDARAQKSKYEIENKPGCAAAYDSAFVSTLRTVRPDVARALNSPN